MSVEDKKRELVLPPGQYAYLQDSTKGNIKVFVGPIVVNQTNQDSPIAFDDTAGRFVSCESMAQSVRYAPVATEGQYIVLTNPADGDKYPTEGQQASPGLKLGRTVNIPGPTSFALWPSQVARVVEGHQLKSNQYLVIVVYNEAEARANWAKSVVRTVGVDGIEALKEIPQPANLTIGTQLIIKGTEASFYIPPTGVSVVPQSQDPTVYVRDALTLEQLDYCILVDEDGTKRYEKGPKVVFPEPTEKFISDNRGEIKFRAIELNQLQGLHVKVITSYTENEREYKEGEELFITGRETQIYYPREEHSLITYDGNQKHFAVAVPSGSARYVMDRHTGNIRTVRGPAMLLPNPVHEIIVRRHLTDNEVDALYPGNVEALEYNRSLREIAQKSPTTRAGVVSEGEIARNSSKRDIGGSRGMTEFANQTYLSNNSLSGFAVMESAASGAIAAAGIASSSAPKKALMPKSNINNSAVTTVGDEMTRSSSYTQPRTLVFGSKFEGVPTIKLFTGYAIMIVDALGKRRVVQGPAVIQLDYDETVEILHLSTGKPKTTDKVFSTPYLLVRNNKVADLFTVTTSDHVNIELKVSHLVHFEGEPTTWFAIGNYVKFLTDHIRSIVKSEVKKIDVQTFYASATDIVRKILLHEDRSGLLFSENNMHVVDVDVLEVTIKDTKLNTLLNLSQTEAIEANLKLQQMRRTVDLVQKEEMLKIELAEARAKSALQSNAVQLEVVQSELSVKLANINSSLQELLKREELVEQEQANLTVVTEHQKDRAALQWEFELAKSKAVQALQVELLSAETKSQLDKLNAALPGFSEALLTLGREETLVKIAEATSVQTLLGGGSLAEVMSRIFAGSGLKEIASKAQEAIVAMPKVNGTGKSQSV